MEGTGIIVNVGGEEYLSPNNCVISSDREVSIGGYGLNPNDGNDVYHQMVYVSAYFGQTPEHWAVHLIVKYDGFIKDDATACKYSELCADYFVSKHQVYYCTHQDLASGRYHTHMLINSVSYVDGKLFDISSENMDKFCNYISKVTGQCCRVYDKQK